MNKLRFFFVLVFSFLLASVLTAQNVSPQFSELKGMEDTQGNTHLFYRIYSYEELQPSGFYEDNSLYHYNLTNQTDTLFIRESGSEISALIYLNDYKIINLNPMHYIYAGSACGMECSPFAYNSNSGMIFSDGSWGSSYKIGVGQNPGLIYYGLIAAASDSTIATLISDNGGLDWDTLSSSKIFLSINPYENQTSFYSDYFNSKLYKSSNGGINFYVSDTTQNYIYSGLPDFYYDIDQNHIYRNSIRGNTDDPNYLAVSSNNGEPFSWSNKYYSNNPIFFSNNASQSGAVYLADGKKIFYSSDYGDIFTLYKELDNRIIGIYKKPNSDKIYAATKYRIYEITDDTITVIKSLPIPEELLAFYPLAVGNKWVYDFVFVDWNLGGYQDIFMREILSEELKPNGKKYFKIYEKYMQMGFESIIYERMDSVEGRVYRYYENCPNSEQLIEDLVMEVNDSSFASRFEYCFEHPPTELLSELNYSKWGFNGKDRNYYSVSLLTSNYNLYSEIGLGYIKLSDDNGDKTFSLKGMLKNEIVYGDTTLTDVTDENELPKEFSLSQNYPNPFNPSTKISWQSPIGSWQTLKVYDVLGNEVAKLVDEYRNAGSYDLNFDASKLSSGVYFYQLKAENNIETRKMILIK